MSAKRKQTRGTAPYYGPRQALYWVAYPGGGGSSTHRRCLAHSEASQSSRSPVIERREYCPEPGCNGRGERSVRVRGRSIFTHRDVPCPTCAHAAAHRPAGEGGPWLEVEPLDPEAVAEARRLYGPSVLLDLEASAQPD